MKLLWQESPQTAKQIINTLSVAVDWSPKTVKTLLNRLVNKKVLGFETAGRYYNYFPIVSEKDCARAEGFSFLNRVYNGSLQPMISSFLDEVTLSEEEIKELKQQLEKSRKRND